MLSGVPQRGGRGGGRPKEQSIWPWHPGWAAGNGCATCKGDTSDRGRKGSEPNITHGSEVQRRSKADNGVTDGADPEEEDNPAAGTTRKRAAGQLGVAWWQPCKQGPEQRSTRAEAAVPAVGVRSPASSSLKGS